jgi:hypothetical protein
VKGKDMGRAKIWVSSATKRKIHEEKTPENTQSVKMNKGK